jgi:hypothetical protein
MSGRPKAFLFAFCFLALFDATVSKSPRNSSSAGLLNRAEPENLKKGWVSSPNGRGTLDIIWSCVLTISLCSWSTLCLNVPRVGDTYWTRAGRKLYMTALGILGPELIFQISFGQYHAARRSVRDFHALGYSTWTWTHAWYTEMGGFLLQTSDCDPFPLNAAQLHYLVKEKLIEFPAITKKAIDDKNKAAAFVRFVTVIQISWFVLNTIGRAAQHLAVTTFELTTLGFITCTFGTCICWLHKPMDVETPTILEPDFTIFEMLARRGKPDDQKWQRTPLDFVQGRSEFSWNKFWAYGQETMNKCRLDFGPKHRPIDMIPNDYIPEPPFRSFPIVFLMHLVYAAIHFTGWNFHFPSRTELILWRFAVSGTAAVIVLIWSVEIYVFRGVPYISRFRNCLRKHTPLREGLRKRLSRATELPVWSKTNSMADRLRNIGNRDEMWKVPLRALVPYAVGGLFYGLARAYILLEAIVTLRALPESAFKSVDWSSVFPHF